MNDKSKRCGIDKPHLKKFFFGWTCSMDGKLTGVGADLKEAYQAFKEGLKSEIKEGWAVIVRD